MASRAPTGNRVSKMCNYQHAAKAEGKSCRRRPPTAAQAAVPHFANRLRGSHKLALLIPSIQASNAIDSPAPDDVTLTCPLPLEMIDHGCRTCMAPVECCCVFVAEPHESLAAQHCLDGAVTLSSSYSSSIDSLVVGHRQPPQDCVL